MVTINSNYAADFAANAAKQNQNSLNGAMEKLSTGKRINSAADDAAGQSIAMRLQGEIQLLLHVLQVYYEKLMSARKWPY